MIKYKKLFLCLLGAGLGASFFASAQTPPPAENYAPNLWFSAGEQYYPTDPYKFFFENGLEIEGKKAVQKYDSLSMDEKLNELVIFYHISDLGTEWVYQYWLLYVFNDAKGLIKNEHYGDWEAIIVFVNKKNHQVVRAIGTGHQRKWFDTEISDIKGNRVWSYIGQGSHANCVDTQGEGTCKFIRRKIFDKWERGGHIAHYPEYSLQEINQDFIINFRLAEKLTKSTTLGIDVGQIVRLQKDYYVDWGGHPPTYAWHQEGYYDATKFRPYAFANWGLVGKYRDIKTRLANFLDNIFGSQEDEVVMLQNKHIPPTQLPLSSDRPDPSPEPAQNKPVAAAEKEIVDDSQPIDEPAAPEEPETSPPKEPDKVVDLGWGYDGLEPVSMPSPPPAFSSGGSGSDADEQAGQGGEQEDEPEDEPEESPPEPEPVIEPPHFVTPSHGAILGLVDANAGCIKMSGTSTPGFSILAYATTTTMYSTTTDANGQWELLVEPQEGSNVFYAQAEDSGYASALASTTFTFDTLPPDAIDDLAATFGDERGSINLSWTAPVGQPQEYIIKYATSTFSWASSTTVVNQIVPAESGVTEDFKVSGLVSGLEYYWAVKSRDAMDNISVVSNTASAAASALSKKVHIGEIKVVHDEFVELYNPTAENVDLSGWYWAYYPANRPWNMPSRLKQFPASSTIPAQGAYLIGLFGYPNDYLDADWIPYSSHTLSNQDGSVAIFTDNPSTSTSTDILVDAVGWGDPDHVYETAPASRMVQNHSLIRHPCGWDTDNNLVDFIKEEWPSPTNSQGDTITFVYSDTVISHDTTWTAEHNPYLLLSTSNETPIVAEDTALSIEPGVQIFGANRYYSNLIVHGSLRARGTEDDPIVFTAWDDDWSGIIFDHASSSLLEYVVFKHGGYRQRGIGATVTIAHSVVTIKNSTFESGQNNNLYALGASVVNIESSYFRDSETGIFLTDASEAFVEDNTFFDLTSAPIRVKGAYTHFAGNRAASSTVNGIVIDQDNVYLGDAVWDGDLVYVLSPSAGHFPTIAASSTLTVLPGTIIKSSNKHYTPLVVEGRLIMEGAADDEIVMTSYHDDGYGGDTNGNGDASQPQLGDWKEIKFQPGSYGSLDNVLFKYGTVVGFKMYGDAEVVVGNISFGL